MEEQKDITKKLIKNTFINFIIFTIILLTFDFIIYNQVSNSLYKDIDKQLKRSKIQVDNFEEPKENNKPIELKKIEINPRLIIILRNKNGETLKTQKVDNIENYIKTIKFDANNIDNIYNFKIENKYSYRCINYKKSENEYIQILANVDGETITLVNLSNTLIFGTAILTLISILLSYALSKRTINPMIEAYKKQTEFVQNASHELRTPLTIIQAKQELLLKEPNKKIIEKSSDINLTLKETKRLSKLIKELMELARADSKKIEIEKEKINIDNLIKEVTNPYMDLAKMQNKELILNLEYSKEININKSKITELLIIILDNAIKYTNKSDKITVKTYQKEGKCNIEISDTGIGISSEGINYIFDRFYREDKARSRQTGGNGLGLSIAKTIINMHNGTIKAMHNNPKGTIILIKL